jgi:hypothetical protein
MKIGEIEDFVRLSDSFMSSVDLQNGVYESDALKMLEDWERNADSIVLGDSKRLLIENNSVPSSNSNSGDARSNAAGRGASADIKWFDSAPK